ncbi:hypothetical protein BYT27DRAFT_7206334 [Phlegmacium glaucopus]|nr:hypothetical protein BYT27DRAFT_7206334 [Phlegmacium glaucopus]
MNTNWKRKVSHPSSTTCTDTRWLTLTGKQRYSGEISDAAGRSAVQRGDQRYSGEISGTAGRSAVQRGDQRYSGEISGINGESNGVTGTVIQGGKSGCSGENNDVARKVGQVVEVVMGKRIFSGYDV